MDRLVQSLGITGLSKSQVSEMANDLDGQVADFRDRPLDTGPYTFLAGRLGHRPPLVNGGARSQLLSQFLVLIAPAAISDARP
jgi:hypothetical protein